MPNPIVVRRVIIAVRLGQAIQPSGVDFITESGIEMVTENNIQLVTE